MYCLAIPYAKINRLNCIASYRTVLVTCSNILLPTKCLCSKMMIMTTTASFSNVDLKAAPYDNASFG